MSNQRLNEIAHLLEGAGSDDAFITLSAGDARLLDLHEVPDTVIVEREEVYTDETRKPLKRMVETEVQAVQPHPAHPDTGAINGYTVHVGLARLALKRKLGDRRVEGRRQKDDADKPNVERIEEVVS